MRIAKVLVIFIVVLAVSACGGKDSVGLEVQDAWARAVGMGGAGSMAGSQGEELQTTEGEEMMSVNGAAYLVVKNSDGEADYLLKADCDVAKAVELHFSEMENGVMKMSPVEKIEIPAGGEVELKPGSYHIMLIGLKQNLMPGDTVSMLLTFENFGEISVEAEVRAP